ncbi:MAG: ribokinase, partial [Anaerolineae bacterium]
MSEHVLVIGATLLDTKGKPVAGLEPGTSNPAVIRSSRGGTARNVAENLARLGAEAVLISAVGDDPTGRQLLIQTAEAGVNLDYVQMLPDRVTGSYIALLEADGLLSVALDDVRVMEAITPDFLNRNRSLFRDASMVMFDGSLTEPAMKTAVRLAREYRVPLCADPASARLAYKLRP